MQEHGSLKEVMKVLYGKMAEREAADLKKEKAAAKKQTKAKSKKNEDEDETAGRYLFGVYLTYAQDRKAGEP